MAANLAKFDPESHPDGVYEAFCDFLDQYEYEYDAVAKEPPKEIDAKDKAAWVEVNKRKIFLGKYSSRSLQKEYEDCTEPQERVVMTFTTMIATLKERFKSGSNTTLANFKFHKLNQNVGESFDSYAIRVKREASLCSFSCSGTCSVPQTLIRDQIIIGTSNDEIRRAALKDQWDLTKLLSQGRSLESADLGVSVIKKEDTSEFGMGNVKRTKPGKYSRKSRPREKETSKESCETCSSWKCPGKKKCPAYDMECFACNKKGHFRGAPACKRSSKKKVTTRRLEESETDSSSDFEEDEDTSGSSSESDKDNRINFTQSRKYVTKIRRMRRAEKKKKSRKNKPRYQVEVVVNGQNIHAFADTGADICIMSTKNAHSLMLPIQKTKMKIKPYGSKKMRCSGEYVGTIMYGNNVTNTSIYIIDQDVETLLSGAVCEDLNIIKYNPSPIHRVASESDSEFVKQFPDVFNGIGMLKDYQVGLHIDQNVKPVVQQARPIPFHLREKFHREIKSMEENGIIEEHHGPAPWISNVVLSPKDDGQTRVTLDMRCTNKAIKATNIPIPRVEEIKAKLAGSDCFSKLDFKSAYHQLELSQESRYITVFHAGDRLMRYKRLTMGTKPASGELTKALSPLFQDIPEAHIIHDDLIIATKTDKHKEVLIKVLQRIKDHNMTLNLEKCHFMKEKIPFWGMIITKDGIMPDPEKVKALQRASRPRTKEELMSFLCMVQSNHDFIEGIAQKSEHLRKLTKKHAEFKWNSNCEKEFKCIKKSFTEDALMRHFDPTLPTFISVDAHNSGLSAILQQGNSLEEAKPILLASRATTAVEARYPQLDLEALAIDFALRRFRYYLIGGPQVTVITDHKPLISIFANIRLGSIRVDRIKLRHQDIDYKVIWRKGKDNPADFLSRHAIPLEELPKDIKKETKEFEKTIWFIQYAPFTEAVSMERIIKHTKQDPLLEKLKTQIVKGYIAKSSKELSAFKKVFDKLTISDKGLILKGEKIVLPTSLIKSALKKAHQGGHPGMNGMKRRLRSHFWMPRLNEHVESFVNSCQKCLLFNPKCTKEKIHPQHVPEKAWDEVSIDLFGPMPDKKHVVVITDNMSRFPDAKIVSSTDAKSVLPAIDKTYTNYGQPSSHRTDNGPPFNSKEFEEYSESNGIEHIKTYPYHPQANPAECFMKPLGKAMKSAFYAKEDREKALNDLLANYRATPHSATNLAPGNVLMRHGYKKDFPRQEVSDQQVAEARKQDVSSKTARGEKMNQSNHRMTSDYDIGDTVYLKNNQRSKFDPLFGPQEYEIVEKKKGGVIVKSLENDSQSRRHLDDVKKLPDVEKEQANDLDIAADDTENSQSEVKEPEVMDTPQESEEEDPPRRKSSRKKCPNPKYNDFVLG